MSNAKQRNVTKLQNRLRTPQESGDDQGLPDKPGSHSGGYATKPPMMDYRMSESFTDADQYALAVQPIASPPSKTTMIMSNDELDRLERQIALQERLQAATQVHIPQPQSPPPSRTGHTYGRLTIRGTDASAHQGNIFDKDTNPNMLASHKFDTVEVVVPSEAGPGKMALLTQGDMTSEAYQATHGKRNKRH